jgi:hypothetical protein
MIDEIKEKLSPKYTQIYFKRGLLFLPKMIPHSVLSPMGLYKVEAFVKVP